MRASLFLSALLVAAPVLAQTAPAGAKLNDSREVRVIGAQYGDCVVKKEAAAASDFVLSQGVKLDARSGGRLMERLNDGTCLRAVVNSFGGVQMHLPLDTMRYTLADALFRSKPLPAPLAIPATLPMLPHPTFDEAEYQAVVAKGGSKEKLDKLAADRSQAIARIFLSAFGECVVRANPAGAHALLRATVATPEENGAFTALRPAFGECLTQGQTFSMNKSTLRGTIALNHYRLAQALQASK